MPHKFYQINIIIEYDWFVQNMYSHAVIVRWGHALWRRWYLWPWQRYTFSKRLLCESCRVVVVIVVGIPFNPLRRWNVHQLTDMRTSSSMQQCAARRIYWLTVPITWPLPRVHKLLARGALHEAYSNTHVARRARPVRGINFFTRLAWCWFSFEMWCGL